MSELEYAEYPKAYVEGLFNASKEMQQEIEKLKYELNNSNMFHCPHFLTDKGGGISCHDDSNLKLEAQNLGLRKLVEEAIENTWTTNFKEFRDRAKEVLSETNNN